MNESMKFVRLDAAAHELGASSPRVFLSEFRTLNDHERREIADLIARGEG